jgi:hypothetical protein
MGSGPPPGTGSVPAVLRDGPPTVTEDGGDASESHPRTRGATPNGTFRGAVGRRSPCCVIVVLPARRRCWRERVALPLFIEFV